MSKADKENVLLKNWYENTVVEDQEDCINIAGMATKECLRRWNIGITPKYGVPVLPSRKAVTAPFR